MLPRRSGVPGRLGIKLVTDLEAKRIFRRKGEKVRFKTQPQGLSSSSIVPGALLPGPHPAPSGFLC